MDIKIDEEFLDELFSSLEALETQSAAVLQFLKVQGEVSDEELAPYMELASKASNVRWRATRLRLMSLLSSAVKSSKEPAQKSEKPSEKDQKASEPAMKQGYTRPAEQEPAQAKAEKTSGAGKQTEQQPKAHGEQQPKTSPEQQPKASPEQQPESSSQEKQPAEKSQKDGRQLEPATQTAPQNPEKKDAA